METVLRVFLVYVFVLFALRVIGKREFSSLSPFDLAMLLLVPQITMPAITREDYSLTNAGIALSTLFLLVLATSLVGHLSPRAEDVIRGRATVLVSRGVLLEDALNQERVQPSEIFGAMHRSGLHTLAQVQWAILEPDGKISVIPVDQPRAGGGRDE